MGVSGGPNIVRGENLVLALDVVDKNSYSSGSLIWNNLAGNEVATLNNTNFSQNTLAFSSSTSRVSVSDQTTLSNFSIELFVKPYTTTTSDDKYLVYSSNLKIVNYASSSDNYFYFIRQVSNVTASFGDSNLYGYTGIKAQIDYGIFSHIVFSHNSTTGQFKTYKNGILVRTIDGFYNNNTMSSTGYGSLIGQDPIFIIGNNITT